jgi:hypothetical protein
VAFTPDQLAVLEAQWAYFRSDEVIKDRAAVWRDASPEDCLAAVIESCNEAAYFLSLKSPDELERVLAPVPLPADTIAILEALQRRR